MSLIIYTSNCVSWVVTGAFAAGFENGESIMDFPYYASVESDGKFVCAASIVDDFFVVSSNSCVIAYSADSLAVRVGTSRLGFRGSWFKVVQVITHKSNGWTQSDGFAMLQVESPIRYSAKASYIYPSRDVIQENQTGTIITWHGTKRASPLVTAAVKVLPSAACSAAFEEVFNITDNMYCVEAADQDSKPCLASLGTPLYSRLQLAGLVIFNPGCGGQAGSSPVVVRGVAGATNFIISTLLEFNLLI